jgi:hypothetical protein
MNSDQTTSDVLMNPVQNIDELPNQITVTEQINEPSITINDTNNETVENTNVCI